MTPNELGIFEDQSAPSLCIYHPQDQSYSLAAAANQEDTLPQVWKRMQGNFIITAQAAFEPGETLQYRLGWVARSNPQPGAVFVSVERREGGVTALRFRRTASGPIEELESPVRDADVLQLERSDERFYMSVARYGETFQSLEAQGIHLAEEVLVGLFALGQAARFHNARLVRPVGSLFERGRDPFSSHLEILDVGSGHRQVIHSRDDVFEAPNWTRDGKALVFNSAGKLYRFDLATRAISPIETGNVIHNNNDHVVSFDGTALAISSHSPEDTHSRIYTLPLAGGQPRLVTPLGPSYLHGWSPDGKHLVYTALRNGDYDIYRIAVEGGPETQLTNSPGLDDGPEYTPDGRYIYFNSVRSGSMQLWRMKADGSNQEQLTDDECNNWFPHISPDGASLIFISYLPGEVAPGDHPAAKRVYLRLMPLDGGAPRVLAYLYGGQGTINVPSWSPDGRQVAFVSNSVP